MRILREWIHRLRGTLLPGRRDGDLEQELRLHLDMAAEDARRRGLDPADAARAARIKAGGASHAMDALRDQRGLPWLDGFVLDCKLGLRMLVKYPGLTLVGGLGMAVGVAIGATSFAFLYASLVTNDVSTLTKYAFDASEPVQTARRSASNRLSHSTSWFQLPKSRVAG